MIRELYQVIEREVTLNVNVGRIDSVRKKNIAKSGCRVYDGGFIGTSGCFGEPTEETWKAAEAALGREVPCPHGPETGKKRTRDLRSEELTPEEFIKRAEIFLATICEEFPQFVLSNKIKMVETEEHLSNDAGLQYSDLDRQYVLSIVVKEKGSPNVFDTFLFSEGRSLDVEKWLSDAREILSAHLTPVPMPEGNEPIFLCSATGDNLAEFDILSKAFSGREYKTGTSLYQGRLGEKLFSERVDLLMDRTSEDTYITRSFFDCEGTTLDGDKVAFVENGVFTRLMLDKKFAALFETESTGCAYGDYDDAPSFYSAALVVGSTGETVRELTSGRNAILLSTASGGDWTDDGTYASPVQCAYLYRDGKLVGRLPEFSITVKVDDLFNDNFIGCSCDTLLGQRMLVFKADII